MDISFLLGRVGNPNVHRANDRGIKDQRPKYIQFSDSLLVLRILAIVIWSINSNELSGRGNYSKIPPYKLFASIMIRKVLGCLGS